MALKFEINVPMQLALTRMDPRFNEQFKTLMYSVLLPDGTEEKMFLPEECGESDGGIDIVSRRLRV